MNKARPSHRNQTFRSHASAIRSHTARSFICGETFVSMARQATVWRGFSTAPESTSSLLHPSRSRYAGSGPIRHRQRRAREMADHPQSDEFKALMSRLRREEEQRAYERIINRPLPPGSFAQRYPGAAGLSYAFSQVNRPVRPEDLGDDDVTYNDVQRQTMLILNVVLSIVGVGATLWVLARWWNTPARLFVSMGGSLLVGVSEVALYWGYIWHLGEARKKERNKRELREVVKTWVVQGHEEDAHGEKTEGVGALAVDMDEKSEASEPRKRRGVLQAP